LLILPPFLSVSPPVARTEPSGSVVRFKKLRGYAIDGTCCQLGDDCVVSSTKAVLDEGPLLWLSGAAGFEDFARGIHCGAAAVDANCPFVRFARAQVRPAPETPVTVMFDDEASVDMKASSNSFGAAVENAELADRVLALVMS
jgi:hypothetical protein